MKPDVRKQLTKTHDEIGKWIGYLAAQPAPPHELSAQALKGKSFKWCRLTYDMRESCERELMKWEILFDEQVLTCLWRGSQEDRGEIMRDIEGRKAGLRERGEKTLDDFAMEKALEVKLIKEGEEEDVEEEDVEEEDVEEEDVEEEDVEEEVRGGG